MLINDFFYKHPVFTYKEFVDWKLQQGLISPPSLNAALSYYIKRKRLLPIRRGLYAVVTPGLTVAELHVDPYLIAAKVSEDSVLAYHTALELHGMAYSSFEQFYFLTKHKVKSFEIAGQWYQPVILPNALIKNTSNSFGIETLNRQGMDIKVTSIARTFVDILDRIDLSGGIEEACRSLEKMVVLNVDEVVEYCLKFKNARLAAKVGYFLEQRKGVFAVSEDQLRPLFAVKPKSKQYLSKGLSKNCVFIKKWNLMMPEFIIKKSWEEPQVDF